MDLENQKIIWQCRGILEPLPDSFEKWELLTDLLLVCQAASSFQRAYQALAVRGENPEDEGAYAAGGGVFLPPNLRWERLLTLRGWDLEAELLRFLESAERRIPELRGAIRPELWERRTRPGQLERLLECYDVWYHWSLTGPLDFSRILEGILLWFPYESAERRFYTPAEVSRLLADLLQPEGGALYDPCCGGGGLLAAMGENMRRRRRQFCLYGHESDQHA